MDSPVIFTSDAAAKVKEIIAEEGNPNLRLRIFVQGGGCSGFQYGFTLDEAIAEDDIEVETDDVKIVIDAMSMQYLQGSTLDYVSTLMGSNFSITNPNTTSKCGCGSSFAV